MPTRKHSTDASDHDLLIRIDTRLEVLSSQVRENNQAVALRLDQLGRDKASYADLDTLRKFIDEREKQTEQRVIDLEANDQKQQQQIDWSRRMIWVAIGILGTLQVIVVPIIIAVALRALSK